MKQPLERPMKQPLERPQEWPMKQPLEWPMKQPLERPSHFAPPSRRACIAPCLGRGLRGLRSGANAAICLDVNGELKSNLNLEGGRQQAVTDTKSD